MEQLGLALEVPTSPAPPKRRIDITLENLEREFNALPEGERAKLIGRPWVWALETIGRLRGMEMAEVEVRGGPLPCDLSEIYDRLVSPGDHPIEALLRVFREYFR